MTKHYWEWQERHVVASNNLKLLKSGKKGFELGLVNDQKYDYTLLKNSKNSLYWP